MLLLGIISVTEQVVSRFVIQIGLERTVRRIVVERMILLGIISVIT
jgi:hypothetical protein